MLHSIPKALSLLGGGGRARARAGRMQIPERPPLSLQAPTAARQTAAAAGRTSLNVVRRQWVAGWSLDAAADCDQVDDAEGTLCLPVCRL